MIPYGYNTPPLEAYDWKYSANTPLLAVGMFIANSFPLHVPCASPCARRFSTVTMNQRTAGFDPPPLDDVSRRQMGVFMANVGPLEAKRLAGRLRAAGIEARTEERPQAWTYQLGFRYYMVRVAYRHLIPASIIWALGGRTHEDWLRMSGKDRIRVARKALLQLALAEEEWRIDRYPGPSLVWLMEKLGMDQAGFKAFLAQTENGFKASVRRDFVLGPVVVAAFLALGILAGRTYWGAYGWQALVCYGLAGVFGLFWLAKLMLRLGDRARKKAAAIGFPHGPPSYDAIVEIAWRSLYACHAREASAATAVAMALAAACVAAGLRWGFASWRAVLLDLPALVLAGAAVSLWMKSKDDTARLNYVLHTSTKTAGAQPVSHTIDFSRDRGMESVLLALTRADGAWWAGDVGSAADLYAEAAAIAGSSSNPDSGLFVYCARIGIARILVARGRDEEASACLVQIEERWKQGREFVALAQELNERAAQNASETEAAIFGVDDVSLGRAGGLDGFPEVTDNPYETAGMYIARARKLLDTGDPKAAYAVLNRLVDHDRRGVCLCMQEFYETLLECERRLGLDTRNTMNQLKELKLDWIAALDKAEKLFEARKYSESIAYFQRSINSNPGEAGTQSMLDAANRGLARALKALGRDA